MSLCKTRNLEEDNDHPEGPIKDIVKLKDNSNENINENKKEKKKKISIPKDSIYKEDEEAFKKSQESEPKKKVVVEIINTDIQKDENEKQEEKMEYKADSTSELIQEVETEKMNNNINNEEKKVIQKEEIKMEKGKIDKIKDKVTDYIKDIEENTINNIGNDIGEAKDNNENGNIINNLIENKKEKEDEKIIKDEHIEKEVEKLKEKQIEINEKENQENKKEIKIEVKNNKDDNKENEKPEEKIITKVEEEKVELEEEKKLNDIAQNEINIKEKENLGSLENFKSIPKKIEDQSENKEEEKEEIPKDKQIETIEEKKEPEQVQEQEQNELKEEKQEKEVGNTDNTSLEDFLTKNDSLIKVINVTLESKGYSKSDIQTKMDEFFQAITETKLGQSHIESISNLLIELLSTTVETDKKDLVQFFKELFTLLEYDKEKIYEQIIQFSEDIEEQEKLKTRKLNRNIRSYIKDCQDNLNQIFKQDDMPPDRIVTFERFNQIAEEVGLNLKKEYLDILLYQMKMALPKIRSIHEFNMIVIVDFLK